MLTTELLETLRARWDAQGAPITGRLRPGVQDDETFSAAAELGLRLPAEARIWWRWHDGADGSGEERCIGPGLEYLSLQEAIDCCERERRAVRESPLAWVREDAEGLWRSSWLPIGRYHWPGYVVCDCASDDELAPVWAVQADKRDEKPHARSLGEAVETWIEAIDSGAWWWDTTEHRWGMARHKFTGDRRRSPLVG